MLRHRGLALGASCLGQLSHAAPHGSCPARTRGEATGRRPCVSRLDPADSADNKQYLPKNASSHLLQEKLSFCEPANMHDFKDELQVTKSNFCCTARLPALPHRACRIESDTLSNPGPNLAVAREPCHLVLPPRKFFVHAVFWVCLLLTAPRFTVTLQPRVRKPQPCRSLCGPPGPAQQKSPRSPLTCRRQCAIRLAPLPAAAVPRTYRCSLRAKFRSIPEE